MRALGSVLLLVAALAGGCSLYNHVEPFDRDMSGCVPSSTCMVDDMRVPDGGGCTLTCPADIGADLADLADLSELPDLARECQDSSTCPSPRPICNGAGAC